MQARGGSRRRPKRRRINGLIALRVFRILPDVRRQRQGPIHLHERHEGGFPGALDQPPPVAQRGEQADGLSIGQNDETPRPEAMRGTGQGFPDIRLHPRRDEPAGRGAPTFPPGRLPAPEPRGKHARVVEDQGVAAAEQAGQLAEPEMLERPAGRQVHESARISGLGRALGDQFLGKDEVEFCEAHVSRCYRESR